MYELTKLLREKNAVIQDDDQTIEIPGQGIVSLKDIEERLQVLFERQMKKDPYIKSDVYLQTAAILFTLSKINSKYKQKMPSEMQEIYNQCIEGIKKDPASIDRIHMQYNVLTEKINDSIYHALRFNQIPMDLSRGRLRRDAELVPKNLERIEFLNEFIGFPLIKEHFQERAIFPIIGDIKDPKIKEKSSNALIFML